MRRPLLILFAAHTAAADPPPLTQPEMQQILRTLQTHSSQREAVSYEALNRAAIAALLREHPQSIQLVTVPAAPSPALPPVVESLTPRIACLRPHDFRTEDVAALSAALTKLAAGETGALILDLRAPAADSDPAVAVALAALFLPKDTPVCNALKTTAAPVWTRDLLVLTDTDTTNTAEVLATVLRAGKRSLLIGSPTRGRTAAVAELPLRKADAGTLTLRYTAQRVTFPAGTADPFGKGLTPDIAAPLDAAEKAKVFALQAKEGLARGVFHPARPRSNEAALVAKTNPELPDRIARTAAPAPSEAPPTDHPLQRAVDLLTAQHALSK